MYTIVYDRIRWNQTQSCIKIGEPKNRQITSAEGLGTRQKYKKSNLDSDVNEITALYDAHTYIEPEQSFSLLLV